MATVNTKEFVRHVVLASRFVCSLDTSPSKWILLGSTIKATNLMSYIEIDYNVWIECHMPVEAINVIKKITSDTIDISIEGNNFIVSADKERYKFSALDSKTFPSFPDSWNKIWDIVYNLWHELKSITPVIPMKSINPVCCCVHFNANDTEMRIAWTDWVKLHDSVFSYTWTPFICNLPLVWFKPCIQAIECMWNSIELYSNGNIYWFVWGGVRTWTMCMQWSFPNYNNEHFLLREFESSISIDRDVLMNWLDKVIMFAEENFKPVLCKAVDNVFSISDSNGLSHVEIPCTWEWAFTINWKLLLDSLWILDWDISILVWWPNKPINFKCENRKHVTCVISPIRK